MRTEAEYLLLRIYCVVSDGAGDHGEIPLHEALVQAAHTAGLAGASVLQAKMGYSQSGAFYCALLDEVLSDQQPIVVEIVDQPARIHPFLPILHSLVHGRRLITLERAEVIVYRQT